MYHFRAKYDLKDRVLSKSLQNRLLWINLRGLRLCANEYRLVAVGYRLDAHGFQLVQRSIYQLRSVAVLVHI